MTSGSRSKHYCRCGTRLARDHPGDECAACEAKRTRLLLGPPSLPPDFWATDLFRDAFAAQHIGHVSRAYRKHPFMVATYGRDGIAQEALGSWFNLTQAQISRIENGPPIRNLDTLAHWARTLCIPLFLLWFRLPNASSELSPIPASPPLSPGTATIKPQPPSMLATSNGSNTADAATMRSFRMTDRQVGGGHLYVNVITYLHTEVAPRLFGSVADGPGLFSGAAALTEMAAWTAHDAGLDRTAEQHLGRANDLVQMSSDQQLGAHIFASLSHLADHLDRPEDAIRYARSGQAVLSGRTQNPALMARLLAMEARGFAALQDSAGCAQLLVQAERALDMTAQEAPSPWISGFDEGSLAAEAARCMQQLGQFAEAQEQAELVILLRTNDRTRSRAFGQLTLVSVLIALGEPEQACTVATDVLNATQSLGSYLVIRRLLDLKTSLELYASNTVVAEFLTCLDIALHERLWLYQWLTKDRAPQGMIRREEV